MSSGDAGDDWDFSPVIELIHSLSAHGDEHVPNKDAEAKHVFEYPISESLTSALGELPNGRDSQLGNFDKIWEYLGQPLRVLPPETVSNRKNFLAVVPAGDTGDEQTNTKGVRWRDEIDGADLADNDEVEDPPRLTKTQRKKERRKERRRALTGTLRDGKTLSSSSENESESESKSPRTPDSKGVIDQILHGASTSNGSKLNGFRLLKRPRISAGTGASPAAKPPAVNGFSRVTNLFDEGIKLATAAAKKAKLMAMLDEKFIDERQYLTGINLVQHTNDITNTNITPEGIHVFVDASNVCTQTADPSSDANKHDK